MDWAPNDVLKLVACLSSLDDVRNQAQGFKVATTTRAMLLLRANTMQKTGELEDMKAGKCNSYSLRVSARDASLIYNPTLYLNRARRSFRFQTKSSFSAKCLLWRAFLFLDVMSCVRRLARQLYNNGCRKKS